MKIIAIIIVFIATTLSLLSERKLLSSGRWTFSAVIRFMATLLFAAAIFGVPFSLRFMTPDKSRIALLVDGSKSMNMYDGQSKSRWERSMELAEKAGRDVKINRYFYGKQGLGHLSDYEQNKMSENTDLKRMLEDIRREPPRALILLSDGNHNLSGNPIDMAGILGFPVYTIGIGPNIELRTPGIKNVSYPDELPPGQKAQIEVNLMNSYHTEKLILTDNAGRIIRQANNAAGNNNINLEVNPTRLGINRYRVSLISGPDTLDQKNIIINVKKDRCDIVYISGNPGWDLKFITRELNSSGSADVHRYLWKEGQWSAAVDYNKGTESISERLNKADVIVLQDIRGNTLNEILEGQIIDRVKNGGRGLLILGQDWLWSFQNRNLYSMLPLALSSNSGTLSGRVQLTKYFAASGILDGTTSENIASITGRFPPLTIKGKPKTPEGAAIVLAQIGPGAVPIWAWRSLGKGRVMQLTVSELWPWKLATGGLMGDSIAFSVLVNGTFRWLAGIENSNIALNSDRIFYYPNEKISLQGTLNIPSGSTGINWTVEVKGPDGKNIHKKMADWGYGQFLTAIDTLPVGEYVYRSRVELSGKTMANTDGRFWVEPFPDQEREKYQNRELLKELARVSGGKYRDIDSLPNNMQWLNEIKNEKTRNSKQPVWMILILMALLLLIEWFWRRINGLS